MDTAALRACYARLEAMGVDVFTCPMQNHKALCSPDGALALNPAAIESGAEEQAILLHEEGHFATGAFYTVQSSYTIRQKQENIANRYIYKRYFPPQRLQAAMAAGLREPWQLAEYFDLPDPGNAGLLPGPGPAGALPRRGALMPPPGNLPYRAIQNSTRPQHRGTSTALRPCLLLYIYV